MELEPRDDVNRIRVSDREREQIIELLGHAAAEGRLTLDEYSERATSAYSARTRGELARLTDDLPATTSVRNAPTKAGQPVAPTPSGPAPESVIAVFGEASRKGNWPVPERLEAKAVFGECRLEFQDAQLQHPVTVIEATVVFGSLIIYVPEGVDVRMGGTAVFGSKESKLKGPVAPGAPVIEIQSKVVFGSVVVKPPKRRWW